MTRTGLLVVIIIAVLSGFLGGKLAGGERQVKVVEKVSTPAEKLQEGSGLSAQDIYKQSSPGVVFIQAGEATGSGFLVSDKGEVLTNAHVVGSARRVQVSFDDGTERVGEVKARDRSLDVALVVLNRPVDVEPLQLGSSANLQVGEVALAIGNPFGLEQTLTVGIVSALKRSIQGLDGYTIPNVIQTDAAINPGNSGGPLLDSGGKVIGINTQIVTGGGQGSVGIGFATPINAVKQDLSSLRAGKARRPAWIGITGMTVDAEVRKQLKLPASVKGVVVQSIAPDSPASKAKIKSGEIITSLDGTPITEMDQIPEKIATLSPGQTVELKVRSENGQERSAKVRLTARPSG